MASKKILRRSDCTPIKERITEVKKKIREIEEDLREPDIPPDLKRRLREKLRQLKLLLRHLNDALATCQRIAALP